MTAIRIYNRMISILTIILAIGAIGINLPRAFGLQPYIVQSGSMEPTIHTGAIAYIDKNDTEVEESKIMTYRMSNGQLVTHRVIEKADTFVFKGDVNSTPDAKAVTQAQIVGTYKFQIPQLGYIIAKIGKKGFMLIAGWIAALNGIGILMEIGSRPGKK